MESDPKSGDFLSDVEITVIVRSGGTDLVVLKKLIQAFSASVTSLVDTKKIVPTEIDVHSNNTFGKKLITLKNKFYIE